MGGVVTDRRAKPAALPVREMKERETPATPDEKVDLLKGLKKLIPPAPKVLPLPEGRENAE